MTRQLDLNLKERKTRKRVAPELARRMIAFLNIKKGWVTRREFWNEQGMSDRQCRLGREASHARILAGQRGYCLLAYAQPDEIRKAANGILAQIKAEQVQYSQLVKRAHKILARPS
jgi:hypothetical protein